MGSSDPPSPPSRTSTDGVVVHPIYKFLYSESEDDGISTVFRESHKSSFSSGSSGSSLMTKRGRSLRVGQQHHVSQSSSSVHSCNSDLRGCREAKADAISNRKQRMPPCSLIVFCFVNHYLTRVYSLHAFPSPPLSALSGEKFPLSLSASAMFEGARAAI